MKRFIVCAMIFFLTATLPAADFERSDYLPARAEFRSNPTPSSNPISQKDVERGKANRIVVYSASWCPPCQRLKPVLASLQQEGYRVEYRDVDRDADRLKYPYTAVPTIFFLRHDAVIKLEMGYRSREQITQTLVIDTYRRDRIETDRRDQKVRLHRAVRPFDQVPIQR